MSLPVQYKDQLRSKRRKKLFLKITFIFFGIIGLAGLSIYLLFFAELFDVRNVSIDGNKIINTVDISGVADNILLDKKWGIPHRLNILFLDTNKIINLILDSFSRIDNISVSKKLFHSLNIEIFERDSLGIWCVKKINDCFYFDNNGITFEEAPKSSGVLFLHVDDYKRGGLSLRERVIEEKWFYKILEAEEELESRMDFKTRLIEIPENSLDEFHVIISGGWKILFSKNLDIPFQIESLKIFIDQKLTPEKLKSLQYIDARIEGRFYYK